ncbi:MAG TPA: hypothetical protein VFH53_08705 [Phycisphaerae bacterium]|nr:hypothetical protein [Phycisphaerae bacterium]HUX15636.1 hypothetical protein [Phycisphaerae bacterium]
MGVFDYAAGALTAAMKGAEGRSVLYRRGEAEVTILSWKSFRAGEVDDGTGVIVVYESWDWFIQAADLGDLGVPQPGDRLIDADPSASPAVEAGGRVYEVAAPPGMKEFQVAGPAGMLLRVHTKQLGGES